MRTPGSLRRQLLCGALAAIVSVVSLDAHTFGTNGRRFTFDGQGGFMVFVSYFAAVRHYQASPSQVSANLAYLASKGVKGIRVFPNWWAAIQQNPKQCIFASDTLMSETAASTGYVVPAQWQHLVNLIALADSYGLVVDVSFAQEPVQNLPFNHYVTALQTVVQSLNGVAQNVMFDLQNEANLGDSTCNKTALSDSQIEYLYDMVSPFKGSNELTISIEQNKHGTYAGATGAAAVGYDITSYHDPRGYPVLSSYPTVPPCATQSGTTAPDWVRCTCDRVVDVSVGLPAYGYPNTKPVYLQEPERSNVVSANPGAYFGNSLLEAAVRAKLSGAAAWTMHTEVGFLIPGFPGSLSGVETQFLDNLNAIVNDDVLYPWNAGYGTICPHIQ